VANALGFTLADHQQQLPRAYRLISAAMAQRPDSGAILDSLGWWYYRNGQYAEARQSLAKAAHKIQDPENAWHLGQAWLALHELSEARAAYETGLAFAPADTRLQQALKALGQADSTNPANSANSANSPHSSNLLNLTHLTGLTGLTNLTNLTNLASSPSHLPCSGLGY
jgi:tetratricopeptide (TPR) repeat protein